MDKISIVIPIHQEDIAFSSLVDWISNTLHQGNFLRRCRGIFYEIIVVCNNPDNQTIKNLQTVPATIPVKIFLEEKKTTRAQLCAKGLTYAQYEILVKIDTMHITQSYDIAPLVQRAREKTDIIVASETASIHANKNQAFLKITDSFLIHHQKIKKEEVFAIRKHVWRTVQFTPRTEKTFLIELLHRIHEAGYTEESYCAAYQKNKQNFRNITDFMKLLHARKEVFLVKNQDIPPQRIFPKDPNSMLNAGFGYKKKQYLIHTTIPHTESAIEPIAFKQQMLILLLIFSFVLCVSFNVILTVQIIIAVLSFIYLFDALFHTSLVFRTIKNPQEITFQKQELKQLQEEDLPLYTILCPLYKEAHILSQFLKGIIKLDYPKKKLDVILLLEEDDKKSIQTIQRMNIPSFVRTLIVPQSLPKTKPKACNYGLAHAKGDYIVIYDAEDIPDPLQLKKAYLGFQKSKSSVACLQAKLNYYNINQNILTRFFTAEYSLWFDIILTGLQSFHTTIPLGGTSNHFKTTVLRKIKAWDPFNVTEDADLGIRLFKIGYETAIVDSVTLEEANCRIGNWLRQRSRWIKGYMQTYLVHTRKPLPFIRERGIHAFIFHLIIGGKLAFIIISPLMWIITLSYFIFHGTFGNFIEILYPPVILYTAIISFIFGNYFYFFCYVLGCVKKEQWSLIKYTFFIPVYWLLMSVAWCIALHQLLFKPHYWEKTIHGLHFKTVKNKKNTNTHIEEKISLNGNPAFTSANI